MTKEQIQKAFEGRWRYKNPYAEINRNSATMSFDGYYDYIKSLCRDFFEAGVALGQRDYVPLHELDTFKMDAPVTPEEAVKQKGMTTSLEVRAEKFCRSLNTTENVQRYGMPMLKAFYDYWSEPNPSRTKMRFELQKTWDINRRLARWARNNFNVNRNGNKPDTNQQRVSKLADILVG